MQPNRVSGHAVSHILRACQNKRRFSDEFAARAEAMDLRHTGYVYKCEFCRGWHITSKRIENSARCDYYLKEEEKK